jgi:kynurenine formamidase
MNLEHLQQHELTRRKALGLAGAAAVTAVAGSAGPAAAAPEAPDRFDDQMFDVAAVEAGAWAPTRYGPGDQRGAFNEVTPRKTAQALRLLDTGRPVATYNLGELMVNGFPAFVTTPPRVYRQRLTVLGYNPGPDFDGILQGTEPLGPNRVSVHEERFDTPPGFDVTYTYQIGTQLDNLNHIGVGATFYNGFKGPDLAATSGTRRLGNEHMGPIVTRGLLLDVLGLKIRQGVRSAYFTAANGEKVLKETYRITVEDIQACLRRARLGDVLPGDVVLLRTGWTHLTRSDPERYVGGEPGIYLREARYLAHRRPAIIGGDGWALEVLDPAVTKGNAFPVHQLLLVKHGIRIGEGIRSEELAGDGVHEFVYLVTPQYARGATAGNTPPAALANRWRY